MWKLGFAIAVAVLISACGGTTDSAGDGAAEPVAVSATDTPDPCTLASDSVLTSYFGDEAVQAETGETGPLVTCRWRDANANSLLIQVASDHDLYRPEPCDGCVELSFGDDGYATESTFQSTATFIAGTIWYSVTTTGFGDDAQSIANLAETIFEEATN